MARENLLNNDDATFTEPSQTFSADRSYVAFGDLDNDGDLDALVAIKDANNQV